MVLSRSSSTIRLGLGAWVLGSAVAALTETPASASPELGVEAAALPFPGPRQFVAGLDLDCFQTPGPSLNVALAVSHLNPVLIGLGLPSHQVLLRELQQTCVAVEKNSFPPQPAAAPFIKHVAFGCYRVDASPLVVAPLLRLQHMNPVLAGFPVHQLFMLRPEQLCVPVSLNGAPIPQEVQRLVEFLDLECYSTDPLGTHPLFSLTLRQLHPELVGMAAHPLTLVPQQRQLCVPVVKNNQVLPPDVSAIARWVDLEKFTASPMGVVAPFIVTLRHLNPLLVDHPPVQVTLQRVQGLMVPVTKNGSTPPPP
jgi:hypothetical protein